MVNKKLLPFIFLLLLLVVWLFVKTSNLEPVHPSRPSHPNVYFEENTFYEGVKQTAKTTASSNYHVSGGIVPHHLLPGFIIADFFYRLGSQKPKTIILLGPNHHEAGNFRVLTSLYSWDTPFGVVEPDQEIINYLLRENIVQTDEKVLPNDHSVAAIIPFIKYYLPHATVVPLLISGQTTEKEVNILADTLSKSMNKEAVLVAPVDFSHYLTSQQAKKKDTQTWEILRNYDYRQLFTLNNDYLDSPPAIATLLKVMQMIGTTKMDLLYNTNSGELIHDDFVETTSYFSLAFY